MIKEPTSSEDGKQIRTCIKCGDTQTKTVSINGIDCEHDYSNWFTVKQPTLTEEGRQIKTCTKCGNTLMVVLPKLDSSSSSNEKTDSSDCNSTVLSLPLLGILSAAGIVFASKRKHD